MDDRQRRVIESLGLNEEQFKVNEVSESDRLDAVEEAIIELADILLGGEADG